MFEGKNILVTGGAGSIGKELVKQLIQYKPRVIRILDNNETGLFDLEQEVLEHKDILRFLIGDVRDRERLICACKNIDLVFHASALKHVYLCEYNPNEAVKTNIIGTQNLIDVCISENVEKMINISTDKAANPTSVMGTTKLIAEKLVAAANIHKGSKRTVFSTVRFGNVLGSRGSIVPLFINQIKKGGPLTLTDEKMTRFIMEPKCSIQLILKAAKLAEGGETFIFRMPSVKIKELAEVMIEKYATCLGKKPSDIEIKIIGKKPGEKIHEDLITDYESYNASEKENLIIVKSLIDPFSDRPLKTGPKIHFVNSEKTVSKSEISSLLDSIKI